MRNIDVSFLMSPACGQDVFLPLRHTDTVLPTAAGCGMMNV